MVCLSAVIRCCSVFEWCGLDKRLALVSMFEGMMSCIMDVNYWMTGLEFCRDIDFTGVHGAGLGNCILMPPG